MKKPVVTLQQAMETSQKAMAIQKAKLDCFERVAGIGKGGDPCKCLKMFTVWDFLPSHSAPLQRLKEIVGAGPRTWKVTVDYAQTCIIDNKRMYLHYPSESNMGIIFDALGGLKGAVFEYRYVPINNLSADKKDCAHKLLLSAFDCEHKLLLSAFENQKDITSFDDEASLLKRFPCRSSDINAATNSSIQEGSNGCDLSISENINGCHPTGPGTPSQSVSPDASTSDHPNNISHFESTDTGQLYDANLSVLIKVPSCQSSDLENINKCAPRDPGTSSQSIGPSMRTFDLPSNISHFGSLGSPNMGQLLYETPLDVPKIPSYQFSYPDFILEASGDNWRRMYVVKSEINNSETLRAESHSHQQSNSRFFRLIRLVVNVNLWVDRAKKRVLALEGLRVHKKQKIVRDLNLLADTASEVG